MGVQAQEGATQSQSQRPPNRNTQLQGSIAATEEPTRKATASESLASNRSDRRLASLHRRGRKMQSAIRPML
eukprot:12573768-Alexandrium_andersonii.AAC.1